MLEHSTKRKACAGEMSEQGGEQWEMKSEGVGAEHGVSQAIVGTLAFTLGQVGATEGI